MAEVAEGEEVQGISGDAGLSKNRAGLFLRGTNGQQPVFREGEVVAVEFDEAVVDGEEERRRGDGEIEVRAGAAAAAIRIGGDRAVAQKDDVAVSVAVDVLEGIRRR